MQSSILPPTSPLIFTDFTFNSAVFAWLMSPEDALTEGIETCTDRAGENHEQRAQDKCLNTKIVFHIYEPYNFVQLSYEKNVLLSKTSLPE